MRQTHLAEGLATTQDPERLDLGAVLGILLNHPDDTSSHEVEGLCPFALADDRLALRERAKPNPAGQIAEDILREVMEERKPVEHRGRLHPPPALQSEPDLARHRPDPAAERTHQVDHSSDQRVQQEQPKRDQDEPGVDASLPQGDDEATEHDLEEDVTGDEQEPRSQDPQDPVDEEADLVPGEMLAMAELADEVVPKELERPGTEVRNPQEIRQHPVAVQFQERDRVEEDVEVGQHRVPVERLGQRRLWKGPREDRRRSRPQALCIGSREGLCDPGAALHHQPVRGVDEERRDPEVDLEPCALQLPSVIDQDQGVPQFMDEHHEVVDEKQNEEPDGEGVPGEREQLRVDVVAEGHDPGQ